MKISETTLTRTGGQLLVDALKVHGVELAFGVPGESYLEALDALYDARDRIRYVICRQDGGAAYMAEAYGKLTGRPGICFVTRGPGATNASIGVHAAHQDSTPMIIFIGQVGNDFVEREAFQEIDYRRMYGPFTKWVAQIDRADRVPEYVSRAFHTAMSGRPGPVALALPEDMLTETATVADTGPYKRIAAHPGEADLDRMREMLARAKRPFVLLGGGGWSAEACADLRAFVEANQLPVGTAFRCQDLYDNRLPNFVGDVGIGINPALSERVKGCDLLLSIGARFDEMTTGGYSLLSVPRPAQKLVHVLPGADDLGRIYEADLPIHSGMPEFARAAAKLARWTRQRGATGRAPRARTSRRGSGRFPRRAISIPARSWRIWRSACRRRRSSPTAPATSPVGSTAFTPTPVTAPNSVRPWARWATGCPPPLPPSSRSPAGR